MSDATKYIVAAGAILKSLYPKLFHVIGETHLLHIYAMKIKSHFENVDHLIAKVKSATVKNKTRQAKFTTIGCPLQLVVIRWRSWLNAVLYYAKNLPEMKAIEESFKKFGILVTQAKVILQTTCLATQLLKIKDQCECLVKLIEKIESGNYTILEAVQAIKELDFGKDTCSINRFIYKRMQNNDTFTVYFQHIQPTFAAVERNFFVLRKLLAKDRNFNVENVK